MAVADAEVYDDAAAAVGIGDAGTEADVTAAVGMPLPMRLRWASAAPVVLDVVVAIMVAAAAAAAAAVAIVSDTAAVDRAQVSVVAVAAVSAESAAAAVAAVDGAAESARPTARASMLPFVRHLHADSGAPWPSCNAIRRRNYSFDSAGVGRRFAGRRGFVAAAAAAGEACASGAAVRAEAPIRDWADEHGEQRPADLGEWDMSGTF